MVSYAKITYPVSERRACRLFRLSRSVNRYQRKVDDPSLIEKIKLLAERRRRFGYRRLHTLLKREGTFMNEKKFKRIYKEQNLSLKIRKGKKLKTMPRAPIALPQKANERWSMDFVSDGLGPRGRRFRILTVVDDFTRQCVLMYVDFSISGATVARELTKIKQLPKVFNIDNGSEFTSKAMDQWAFEKVIKLDFIRPGKTK